MTQPCEQAEMIAVLKENVEEIKKGVERTLKILEGNSGVGLKTQTELNRTSLTRLWYFNSVVGLGIIVGVVKIVFFS